MHSLACSFWRIWWPWKRPEIFVLVMGLQLIWACCSSLAEGQPGCWAGHLPGQWSLRTEACSTPRHYGWPVANVWGWSLSSCCHEQHFPPTPKLQQPNIPWQLPSRLGHQLQSSRHSFPCAEDDGFFPRGTGVQRDWTWSCSFPLPFLLCLDLTCWYFVMLCSNEREKPVVLATCTRHWWKWAD